MFGGRWPKFDADYAWSKSIGSESSDHPISLALIMPILFANSMAYFALRDTPARINSVGVDLLGQLRCG